jgi:carbonic anhydrase
MQKLIEGVHKFQTRQFGRYRELFQRLARDGQNPHTLFITCSDSRVLAELITQSRPGDLFVVKNAGNIVPPATVQGTTNSTAAAIEFAVDVLGVSDVVICGHSQCGAMSALIEGGVDPARVPHLARWIEVAAPVREVIRERYTHLVDSLDRLTAAGEENVLFGLDNLRTYPCVAARLDAGTLHLHAWFFKIATAELFAFDPEARQFEPLLGLPETGSS